METVLTIPNQKSKIKWTSYLATAYAEGFCEGEDATAEQQAEAWAVIIKYKLYKGLQGWFGRNASELINTEIVDEEGTINWEKLNDYGRDQYEEDKDELD